MENWNRAIQIILKLYLITYLFPSFKLCIMNSFIFYFEKQPNPTSSAISVSFGLNLLPSGLLDTKPNELSREYKDGFDPFKNDHKTKANLLHKECKLSLYLCYF